MDGFENREGYQNQENYQNQGNGQNPERFESQENFGNPERFESRENFGNPERFESRENFGNPERFESRENFGNPERFESQENFGNPERFESQENFGNPERFESRENFGNPERFESQESFRGREESWGQENNGNQTPADYYAYGQTEYKGTYTQEDGWYRPVGEKEKPERKKNGLVGRIVKFAALALTFGVIAGTSFAGAMHFFGKVTGQNSDGRAGFSFSGDGEALSGGDLHIAEGTEAADPVANRTDSKKQAAEGAVTDVSDIVEQAMPSIVSITTIARTQVPSFFFGYSQGYEETEECGSGILISQDEEYLYIATNNHVVEGAKTLTVLFADGSTADAQIKGCDASSDLAVVSVAIRDLEDETKQKIRVATFGNSSALKIGQTAIAIGNALGYGQSVTTGVISALDREVTITNERDNSSITNELLQTSAAINPGNSGGALLNANGEVIGITSVKYSETSVEGMGYAIPAETAIPIIRQLITREVVTGSDTAYLGISGVDVTQVVSDTYQMPQGVYIAQIVEGGSAAQAGLLQGDIITRFDGRNIKSMEEMQELLRYLPAGTTVEVTVQRAKNGEYKEQTLEVILGSKK